MDILKSKVLVLNKCWVPVRAITAKRAIILMYSQYNNGKFKAHVVDPESCITYSITEWEKLDPTENCLSSGSRKMRMPTIIILTDYDKQPKKLMGFSKRYILIRDQICQYCGKYLTQGKSTIDHILPKSQGGQTTYKNCVASCRKCNELKGCRTPAQANMKLIREPFVPNFEIMFGTKKNPNWDKFFGN